MCVGRCKRLFIVGTLVVEREALLLLPSSLQTIDSTQHAERGRGLEKEVKLKGGVCQLRGGARPKRKGGETVSAEVAPIGCTWDGCVCFREERAERTAGKATEKRRASSRDLLDEQGLRGE